MLSSTRTLLSAAPLGLLALVPGLAACTSSDDIGGCWQVIDGDREVSLFIDTDDGTMLGIELSGSDEDPVRTDLEGRWEDSGGGRYRMDATCTRREPGGCEGIARWSLQCTLEDDVLRCSGAPFGEPTELTTCQGSATVPTP